MKSSFFAVCLSALLLIALSLIAAACASSSGGQPDPAATPDPRNTDPAASSFNRFASIGFYICGELLPTIADAPPDISDTPGNPEGVTLPYYLADGIIHIPAQDEAGFLTPARLGSIGDFISTSASGFAINDDSLTLIKDELAQVYSEAEGCDGKPADLNITLWEISGAGANVLENPRVFADNLADVELTRAAEAITISLVPPGSPLAPLPLSTLEMLEIDDVIATGNLPTPSQLELVPAKANPPPPGQQITLNPTPCPPEEGEPPIRITQFSYLPGICLNPANEYTAIFQTSLGDIYVELDNRTFATTNTFLVLARYLYYDGSALFRTEPLQGIIQGGAPHTNRVDDPGPGFTIPDENLDFDYGPGQLLMARNRATNSANGQFIFSVTENSERLEASGNVVFGRVTQGMEILRRILSLHAEDPNAASEEAGFFLGGPIRPVIIERVIIQEDLP